MNFVSYVFAVFIVVVFALYWVMPRSTRNIFLWGASYFFYGWWDWRFLFLLLISTTIDYICGRLLERVEQPARRKSIVAVSLISNLGLLGVFKYYNFFIASLAALCDTLGLPISMPVMHIILPVGISFYTFQTISYTVDVYRGHLKPTHSFVDFAVYVSLFPQLVAGPIERGASLLPQVIQPRRFSAEQFHDGLMLIATGFFRKTVIADNMALLANAVFTQDAGSLSGFDMLLGVYAFAWQIYGDFSGYSDIARGTAKLLGFELMVNFRQPYLATNPSDFWRRWHISLSSWLKDYLYIPLGGNRGGERKTMRNLVLVMLLGGLWHGAAWTFVFWGALHGTWLILDRWLRKVRPPAVSSRDNRLLHVVKIIGAFHVVCLGWLFFRVDGVGHGFEMLGALTNWSMSPVTIPAYAMLVFFATPLLLCDLLCEIRREEYPFQHGSLHGRVLLCMTLVMCVLLLGKGDANAFIYFQF